MKQVVIENPVINCAFEEPTRHFRFTDEGITDEKVESRRKSAYFIPIAAPEDVIIKKMEYYKEGGSDKHLRDIAGILKISGESVDRAYIFEWAHRLGLLEIWGAIQKKLNEKS